MRLFRLIGFVLCLLIGFAMSGFPVAAQGDTPAPVTLTPRNLLDGYCRYNAILPLAVKLENQGEALTGQLVALTQIGGSDLRPAYTAEVTLPALGRKVLMLYPQFYDYTNTLKIQLKVRGRVIVEQSLPLTCIGDGDWLIGVISDNGLSNFEGLRDATPPNGRTYLANLPAEWLPETGLALGALDAVLISGTDTTAWSQEQRDGLKNWIAQGGTLIVTGASFQLTAAGLSDVLPLIPKNSLTMRDLQALEHFDEQSVLADDVPTPVVSGELQPGSEVIAEQNSIPLITRRPFGRGQVFFLGFDPTLAPLRTWSGLPKMYQTLLNWRVNTATWKQGILQADYAAEAVRYSKMPTLGLFLLCGLVGIYLLTAGPLNFLVLRLQKRSELAWLSVPLLAIGFSILIGLAGMQLRGSSPILQQLTLVQISTTGHGRIDSAVGVFSPRRGKQTLLLPKNSLAYDLDNTSFGNSDWQLTRLERGESSLQFQMNSAEFRSFVVQRETIQTPLNSDITLELDNQTARLFGSIENRSGLNLKDVALLTPGSSGLYLGSFDAGETKEIDTILTLNTYATINPATPRISYYYAPSEDTANLLIGQDLSIVDTEDLKWQQRSKFINAILYDEDYGYKGRGNGVYLSGWVEDQTPLHIEAQPPAQNNSQTLYIFELDTQITPTSSNPTLTPGLFLWSPFSGTSSQDISPYDFYLYQDDELILEFEPLFPQLMIGASVQKLVFQVEAYGSTGAASLDVALWNFRTNQWDQIPNVQWGANPISNPQDYVSPLGQIRVHLQTNATSPYSVDIESADFTLSLTIPPVGAP